MAHECPDCYMVCYCGGDIDDIEFDCGPPGGCRCDCYKDTDDDGDFYDGDENAATLLREAQRGT